MNIIRGTLFGVLLWVLIYVELSIFRQGFGMTGILSEIFHFVFIILFVFLCSWLYYKEGDNMKGYCLGLLFILVNIAGNIVLVAFSDQGFGTFYSSWSFWVVLVLMVLVAGVYGHVITKKPEFGPKKPEGVNVMDPNMVQKTNPIGTKNNV